MAVGSVHLDVVDIVGILDVHGSSQICKSSKKYGHMSNSLDWSCTIDKAYTFLNSLECTSTLLDQRDLRHGGSNLDPQGVECHQF